MERMKYWFSVAIDKMFKLLLVVCGLFALYLVLAVTMFSSFKIPSDSMAPALLPGDNILVNKCVMGGRIFNVWDALEDKDVNISRPNMEISG